MNQGVKRTVISNLVLGKVENATVQELLLFITTCNIIPPSDFSEKLSTTFTEKSCLAISSTCGLSMVIPLDKTRNTTVLATTEKLLVATKFNDVFQW